VELLRQEGSSNLAGKKNKGKNKAKAHSTIQQHKQVGKSLVPPLLTLPKLAPTSWVNNRMPEMLWAALLVAHLERTYALSIFRRVAQYGFETMRDMEGPIDITHTGLSKMESEHRTAILNIICSQSGVNAVLKPLGLLKGLPARADWLNTIGEDPQEEDWQKIMLAVAVTLDHQSQESTDCRWIKVLFQIVIGKMLFPRELAEQANEIINYPSQGDLRAVRPTIRAMEGSLDTPQPDYVWSKIFWDQCLSDTPCGSGFELGSGLSQVGFTPICEDEIYLLVTEHFQKTLRTTAVDPKHDTIFGMALFCLTILKELLHGENRVSLLGRMGLRSVVESYITLAYLIKKDDPELWKEHRVYGAGQAKLTFLKLDDMVTPPSYVSIDTLKNLANEDIYQEFLPINLGHWEKTNLRSMSEAAGVKSEYDRFYSWTSTYLHGHWGAIRDSVFDLCHNPLHRLHRIPRPSARRLEDVVPDICYLIDGILDILDSAFPSFPHRIIASTKK
jgi:hypothetical protein